jgi:hypothetical protein
LIASQPFTGECFTSEARGAIWHEHRHRFCVAFFAVAGNRVLDAASAEGCNSGQFGTVGRSFGEWDR